MRSTVLSERRVDSTPLRLTGRNKGLSPSCSISALLSQVSTAATAHVSGFSRSILKWAINDSDCRLTLQRAPPPGTHPRIVLASDTASRDETKRRRHPAQPRPPLRQRTWPV